MSQLLPYRSIKIDSNIKLDRILRTPDDAVVGFIAECDLKCPKHVHDKFKQFPPCPENITPKKEWLRQVQNELIEESNIKTTCSKDLIYMNIKISVYIIEI